MSQPTLLSYRSLIWNFAQRDLKARFKGTAVGWGWSLAVPLASLLIYALVFGLLFRAPPPNFGSGHKGNFAAWLFVGLTVWGFFANGINTAIGALLGAGPLLKKIYFPAYAPVIGSIIAVAIQSLIEVVLVLGTMLAFGNIGFSWLLVPIWAVVFAAFVTALSLVLSIANIYLRDLSHIVSVALQLFFYATPIMFPASLLSGHPTLQRVISANPMSQFVEIFRDLVYGLTPGAWGAWLYILGWSAVIIAISAWAFGRFGRDLGEQL